MRGLARATTIAFLSLSTSMGITSAAFGQEDGVTLDPGDPAAKEYALPHEEARREANGDAGARVQPGRRSSSLFGEGVGDAATETSPRKRGSENEQAVKGTTESSQPPGTTPPSTTPSATQTLTEADGPSATTALVGGGAAAVIAALLGGYGLRALRGPDDE